MLLLGSEERERSDGRGRRLLLVRGERVADVGGHDRIWAAASSVRDLAGARDECRVARNAAASTDG